MTEKTIVHFIRHGMVENPEEKYYGHLPGFRLSKQGVQQAKAAAKVMVQYPIAAVFSSPLERAVETAEVIVKALGNHVPIQRSDLLLEVYSPFDGQPISQLIDRNWDVYAGTQPPYEQPLDVLARAQAFAAKVSKEYKGRHVIAATHGDVITFMIAWAAGRPITNEQKQAIETGYPGYASITSFTFHPESVNKLPEFSYQIPYV